MSLRRKLAKFIYKYHGDNSIGSSPIIKEVVDMGIKEAEARGMQPDVILMSPSQHKVVYEEDLELPIISYHWLDRMYLLDTGEL